jgi:GGDEF domain-containing protein
MIIADAFDAMTTNRIYKARMSGSDALIEIQANSGTQFDPKIVPFACKALSKIVINQDITQLPKSNMENERFAYFFHDSVTDSYNQEYLTLFLQAVPEDGNYQACVYFLRNFSQYNNKFDWEVGNILLKTFADHLKNVYHDATLFRIQGDDFILISKESFSEECAHPIFLEGTGVQSECHHLPVSDNFIDNIRRLEQRSRSI